MRRRYIVVQTLGNMEQPLTWNGISPQERFEIIQRRFIAVDLLRGDDGVERHAELRRRVGEQVVVDIGKHSQLVTRVQPLQSRNGVGEWLPATNGLGKTNGLAVTDLEA